MAIENIIELLGKYPFAVSLSLVFLWILIELTKLGIEFIRNKILSNSMNIKSHSFFSNMDSFTKRRIDQLVIEDEFKDLIGKDFLKIKFSYFRESMKEFLDSNYKELKEDELNDKLITLLNTTISKYEDKALADGIPKMFIDKFNIFHKNTVDETAKFITDICYSNGFSNNEQKICSILHFLTGAFMRTLLDFQITIISINGDLEGLEYKGLICKPH